MMRHACVACFSVAMVVLGGGCEAMDGSITGGPVDDTTIRDGSSARGICQVPVLPGPGERPVDIMDADRLGYIAERMPCVASPELVALFESADTMWYDRYSIIPGYQDSAGDNSGFPVGFRPNTIQPHLIVTGGHDALFEEIGTFHFPFGRPIGSNEQQVAVVDFWQLPRRGGELLPAVWWTRRPTSFTYRYEWMFPVGTVFGELMFVIGPEGEWMPFEIRTRTRTLTTWTVDVHRPFPEAVDLADALENRRATDPQWESSEVDALIAHLRTESTLEPASLSSSNYSLTFDTIEGARDVLPPLSQPQLVSSLLREEPFRSSLGKVWKTSGSLQAYAPTTDAGFHVVPQGYTGGFIEVSDSACENCHRDAGRPFRDYYDFVVLYGELWGGDETFTWHPFQTDKFVNTNTGHVVNFNYNNRVIRPDFKAAGVVTGYDQGTHGGDDYQRIVRDWSDFQYF